ncbi:MAG: hypothetical protein DDT26_00048 [Dehalococcoidia bacterium]|nr:hypothetical protein [Chloroflexota bacterium]
MILKAIEPYLTVIRLVAVVVVVLVVVLVVAYGAYTINEWRKAALLNRDFVSADKSARAGIRDAGRSATGRLDADIVTAAAREVFDKQIELDSANEPQTFDRDSASVPDSRLRAFVERRKQREKAAIDRLSRAGIDSPFGLGPAPAAERPLVLPRNGENRD